MTTAPLHVRVWAKPGSKRTRVGGSHGDPPRLVVRVAVPAVDGAANEAIRVALARALHVRAGQVVILRGHRGRDKAVMITDPPPDLPARWSDLLSTVG